MKTLSKLHNIKRKNKIMIMIIITLIIGLFNFVYYNYQVFKLDPSLREYYLDFEEDIEFEGFELEDGKLTRVDEDATISFNLNGKYTRNIIIEYLSDSDFTAVYSGKIGNAYGFPVEYNKEDICYDFLSLCGKNINKKVEEMNISLKVEEVEEIIDEEEINENIDEITEEDEFENVTISSIKISSEIYFNFITFFFWTIGLNLILLVLFEYEFFFKNKHCLFLLISLSLGSIYLVNSHNITSTTMDDETHYKRSLSVVRNDKISEADYQLTTYRIRFYNLDTKIERDKYNKYLNENDDTLVYDYDNSNKFVPNRLSYFPLSIIMKISQVLKLNKMTGFLLARITNLIIYSFVIALAIKYIPNYKNLLFVIGLIPQSLMLATNFNYDPTVTSFTLLAFSIFLYEYHNKNKKLKLSSVLIFTLSALYGCLPKAIYAPILLLMLLLPKEKFRNDKERKIFKILIAFIFICCMYTFAGSMIFGGMGSGDARGGSVAPDSQLHLIMSSPVSFIKVFWNQFVLLTFSRLISPETYGLLTYYGSMNIDISYLFILIALVLSYLGNNEYKKIQTSHKMFITIMCAFIICEIWGSMYIEFTQYGSDVVGGVQNRYFIPLLFPLMYTFTTPKIKNNIDSKLCMIVCSMLMISTNLYLIYNIITKIYFL